MMTIRLNARRCPPRIAAIAAQASSQREALAVLDEPCAGCKGAP